MGKLETLEAFKKKINVELEIYFDKVIAETYEIDREITGALKHCKKIMLSGGKRARAAFMYYGYLAAGGKELKKILKASTSIEFIHLFLLIQDDIIDQDEKRHSVITTHEYYKKISRSFLKNKNPEHFGVSMAIIISDIINALGNQIIFESGFDPKLIIEALIKIQKIISMTAIGESKDIHIENKGKATTKEILHMYECKTAKYTFEGPLHLGAILGGGNERLLNQLSKYAIPAGIAFQIQDDILGIFGDDKKTGKPTGSDIRQGKYTLLVAKAFEKADKKQKDILNGALGNKNLTQKEINNFRLAIVETGSLEYAKDLAQKLVAEAKEGLNDMKINPEAKDFLTEIADYMIKREL